jgi:hypothetical protein
MWIFTWIINWMHRFFHRPLIIPYENLYPLGTPKEKIIETVENLVYKRVEEITPDGKVILKYDEATTTFLYWSEKTIKYKYLEVAARKYVILFDCKDVYVNIFRELWKVLQKKEIEPVTGPFAKFQSYNTVTHKLNNKKIVNERSNQYKYMGKKIEEVPLVTYKQISFREFKNTL